MWEDVGEWRRLSGPLITCIVSVVMFALCGGLCVCCVLRAECIVMSFVLVCCFRVWEFFNLVAPLRVLFIAVYRCFVLDCFALYSSCSATESRDMKEAQDDIGNARINTLGTATCGPSRTRSTKVSYMRKVTNRSALNVWDLLWVFKTPSGT